MDLVWLAGDYVPQNAGGAGPARRAMGFADYPDDLQRLTLASRPPLRRTTLGRLRCQPPRRRQFCLRRVSS